jgi:hypothetical protein
MSISITVYVYTVRSTVYTSILVHVYIVYIYIYVETDTISDSIQTVLNLISGMDMYLMTPYLQDMTLYQPRYSVVELIKHKTIFPVN